MSEYSVQQQKIISQYRQSKNLGYVITDDEVVSIMQKEMQKTGKVYPGFENLAVSTKGNKDAAKTESSTPVSQNKNLFEIGGAKDLSIGVTLERTNQNYATLTPTQSQTEAINFLKDITTDADTTVKEREKESGVLSTVVNGWQEVFNKEYAKTTVKNEITKTKQDLIQLEKASKGEPIAYDFLGNPKVATFEETFKKTRGVEFNEKNIQDCQEKAQDYAQVKTAVEMINKTKENLSFATKGDLTSQMSPEKSSKAIIDAFKLAGVNSKEEINKTLKDINEKYKNHPDVKKYGGDFRLGKNKQGKYVIYRTDKSGYPAEATNEELKLIAKEMSTRLDKSLATALGVDYKKDSTPEELSALTQQTLEKYQKEYEASFTKAYGKKDLKNLSEQYVQKQQRGVANIEMGLNIASMALMVVPGGAVATSGWALKGAVALKGTTTGAKVVKGLSLVDKAKKGVKVAQTLQKVQQAASPVIMANMTLRPTELLEQLSSENGMSAEEWQAWGEGVLQNSVYMAVGMQASKFAEQGAALYKTKALVKTLRQSGKSADEVFAMIKANPVKFPNDIVKSFKKIDTLAKRLQVSSEVVLDISSTYMINKVMGNGDVTKQDWINSVAFAISGGVLQKQFAHLNTESKVKYIHDAFKEYGVTKEEAQNILKTMDDISEGKIRVSSKSQKTNTPKNVSTKSNQEANTTVNTQTNSQNTTTLDEVVITAPKGSTPSQVKDVPINEQLAKANTREEFVSLREKIKNMPEGPEKKLLQEEYLKKYNEWSQSPNRPNIKMEYVQETSKKNVIEVLKQLGANDKEVSKFLENANDEVINFIQSRISSPDFNPQHENYFIHLKDFNLSLIQEIASDPKFPKEQLSLVANAAYTPMFTNQIRNAYKKGIDIIPGCNRVIKMKEAQEAKMNDPVVIANQKAYDAAKERIKANSSLTDMNIREFSEYTNIREPAIQDLIIFCEQNEIKGYHNLLWRCSENRAGDKLTSEDIEVRVKFAQKGLENSLEPSEVSSLLWEYEKYSPEEMENRLNAEIDAARLENEKRIAKETSITGKKSSILEKYNTAETKDIIERIITKEDLPEDLLNNFDAILGENPNRATCIFFEKCISEIKPEEFSLENFKRDFESGLKKPNITSGLDAKWQARPKAKEVILTQEYLSSLKDENGKSVFNERAIASIIKKGKTNPELTKEVVDMALESPNLRVPAVIEPLLEAAEIDKDCAFSIISAKNNNGEPRFDMLDLSFILTNFKSKLPLVKETFNLEKLYDMSIDVSSLLLRAESAEDVRTQFSYQYCKVLENMKKSDGSLMYHPYWDIQECIQQGLIDNPELTLYYLKKNLPNERTAYDGKVIQAINNIAKKNPELEKNFRQELESIKNDETRVQRDNVLSKIRAFSQVDNLDNAIKIYDNREELGLGSSVLVGVIEKSDSIPYENFVHLKDVLGKERIGELSSRDIILAAEFSYLANAKSVNEIPMEAKKSLLRHLVSTNADLFNISDSLAKDFPLIPRNQEQYCELLPSLVRSLGIETVKLSPQRVESFNKSIGNLSQTVAEISDSDFANLHITQEYSKDNFIKTVLEKVKDLSHAERQKVFDYYGFEIKSNDENKNLGYSLNGYPVNLNNGKKLAEITDKKTQAVVESLREDVVRFTENNRIKCENTAVEKLLNEIAEDLPEIRTMIGKQQHGTHNFDVMQHSLKVMQKITQDPKFNTLDKSDQKIMFLASILHDITKKEGVSDKIHADNGSFDAFYIAKKFNLTREEEIKLYTLIRHHEWMEVVNTSTNSKDLTKRLQSVAFDLQQGNLFDMALMFTHADLKAVKVDNSFHDSTNSSINPKFNENEERIFASKEGSPVSLGNAADIYAKRIKTYINELKKSIPLTPVTQVPSTDVIKSHIKQINPDGSTEHKGVYVDKDGLVVIKFNEVTDWEALGFPKGTTTSGISGTGKLRDKSSSNGIIKSEFNTGNFKFFAHALNYANQLVKFDSFGLPDSDALLSVTYMERPESKYRNYRTQGIGLNIKSKYVYGGGETDAGSGCSKDINEFKNNYIFGGHREKDRLFTAELIKKATGMSDAEYIEFVMKNENRSWNEIEPIDNSDPVEFRNKLIKAFAENIVSNQRAQNRAYDEYYASNPEPPMFTWAYSADSNEIISNPLEFLHRSELTETEAKLGRVGEIELTSVEERTRFLREYSLEKHIPFIIFGN